MQFYDETRYLTDALIRYYEVLPESQSELEDLKDIQAELATIYLIIQLMLRTPADEAKMIDEHLTYINEILLNACRKEATSTTKSCECKKQRNAKNSIKKRWRGN